MPKSASIHQSIVNLTQKLVKTPSQAYVNSCDDVFQVIAQWLDMNTTLGFQTLRRDGEAVAMLITVEATDPGPTICLDACVDTAPAGDASAWTSRDPFSAATIRGTLFGRGTADSKAAVATFCHVADQVQREGLLKSGTLHVLFDGDEHTGNFAGIKAYIEDFQGDPDFVAIGYPGDDKIVVGARGFYRATIKVYGRETHSGGTKDRPEDNAIVKMAHLIQRLMAQPLSTAEGDFPLPPKVSVTEVSGGKGFSQIPGTCEVGVDFRLTPEFDKNACMTLLRSVITELDLAHPTGRPSTWSSPESWPSYRLPEEYAPVREMKAIAEREVGRPVPLVVCGPSNIGNYLAAKGIAATCGFGARYRNIHAPDEQIEIRSLLPVYQTYLRSVEVWSSLNKESFRLPQLVETAPRLRQVR